MDGGNRLKLYYAIPQVHDDCPMQTACEPMPLAELGVHLAEWLQRYEAQGYFSNCKCERIPLDQISFLIQPEEGQ